MPPQRKYNSFETAQHISKKSYYTDMMLIWSRVHHDGGITWKIAQWCSG